MQVPVVVPPLSVQVNVSSTPPLIVTRVSNDENPIPLTVTVSPTTPAVGERVRLGVVSRNVAVAVSEAPPSVPTAEIVWGPSAAAVTVNMQVPVIAPPLSVQVNVASTPPLTVMCASDLANPLPATVTASPTTPVDGESVMLGTVTVNVAAPVSAAPPTTFPTAVIV